MKATNEQAGQRLTDVLNELALAQDTPDAELLDDFTQRYPEYAEHLTEYAVELALAAAVEATAPPPAPTAETTASAMKAMSRFQNRLFELGKQEATPAATSASAPTNPFVSLRTNELRALITRLDVNPAFLMLLRDRRIREETIPHWFRANLERELAVSTEVLQAHLAAAPEVQAATSFKSDAKPQVAPKETFDDAVRNSGLTAEQQAALRKG
jgi:hypothetical protein